MKWFVWMSTKLVTLCAMAAQRLLVPMFTPSRTVVASQHVAVTLAAMPGIVKGCERHPELRYGDFLPAWIRALSLSAVEPGEGI